MIKLKRLLFPLIIIIIALHSCFAANNDVSEFKYLYFKLDKNAQTNKIAYSIETQNDKDYYFEMKFKYNNIIQEKTCEKTLEKNSEIEFKKIICEVPKLGDGKYEFIATISDENNNLIEERKNIQNLYKNTKSEISFIENGEQTTIVIDIEGTDENLQVLHEIPKEVIESLTEENKNSLIKTDYEYEIIEEDPLIAWNIDRPPRKINYTINKQLTQEERDKFNVEITEKSYFNFIKYLTILLIAGILIFLLYPTIKKKNKNKK